MDEQLDLNLAVSDAQKERDSWCDKIKGYENSFKEFTDRGDKIIDRYRNEQANGDLSTRIIRYNLLYSNIATLGPAIYAKAPTPEVSRRYFDKDPIGRLGSAVLERALKYEMDITDFDGEVLKCRDDYLLIGRGTLWQRYDPIIEKAAQDPDGQPDDPDLPGNDGLDTDGQHTPDIDDNDGPPMEDKVIGENAPTDYVHWKDFLHGPAQNWKQVPWVGRKVLMDKASVDKRWPAEDGMGQKVSHYVSFTHKQEKDVEKDNRKQITKGNLAIIYELWDRTKYQVTWYSPDLKTKVIETVPDPLMITDFYPCPEPLFATMTTDRLMPVADFKFYQDQASEIDQLTQRISLLVKACAVRGVYDASNGNLANLLNERPANFMLPVDNWAAFAEKGGLQGQTSFLPIDMIIKTIVQLQAARLQAIQDVYAITGIADIIRGNSNPNETATAQQIKGQFANLRLSNRRAAVAKFLREALRIKAQVICDHFDQSTLRQISGFDQMTEVAHAVANDNETADSLWEKTYALLRNDPLRLTRIDIETDSMVEVDRQQEQQARVEFLTAVGGFLKQAMDMVMQAPETAGLAGELLAFGVRGFKIGRELEGVIDDAIEQLTQMAKQPRPPSPEMIEAQSRLEIEKRQTQNDAAAHDLEKQKAVDDAAQRRFEFEETIKLQREELMLKFGINPFIEAALAAKDTDAANDSVAA